MIEFEEYKQRLEELEETLGKLGVSLWRGSQKERDRRTRRRNC